MEGATGTEKPVAHASDGTSTRGRNHRSEPSAEGIFLCLPTGHTKCNDDEPKTHESTAMSGTNGRPSLPVVKAAGAQEFSGEGVTWASSINAETAGCDEFEFGSGRLLPGASSRITPENQFDEASEESVAMIVGGVATVTVDGNRRDLSAPDCLFVPAGASYAFENAGDDPVDFLWGAATTEKPPLLGDCTSIDHEGTAQVIKTIADVDANVTIEPGDTVRHWPAVFPETAGSEHLNIGLFRRPPGSSVRMHQHDPVTITEAFTVVEGTLLVRDHDGTEHVLEPGDFLYVPEYGMHNNKNVGTDDVLYACLETPARSRDITPMQ